METQTVVKKQKKKAGFGKILGIILLSLFLLVFVSVAALYIYLNRSEVLTDDIAACVAAEPMSAQERLSVSAADSTVSFLIDKNDVYWVMDDRGLLLNQPDVVNELANYDVRLDGWSVSFGTDTLMLNVRLVWKEAIVLPLHLEAGLLSEDGNMIATINALYIGDKIKITPEQIGEYLPIALEYSRLEVTEDGMDRDFCDRLKYLKDISLTPEGVVITCSLGMEMFDMQRDYMDDTRLSTYFLPEAETAMYAAELEDTGAVAEWGAIMKGFEEDPASLVSFKQTQLTDVHSVGCEAYFGKEQMKYIDRFFGGLDAADAKSAHRKLDGLRQARMDGIEYMETSLYYNMKAGVVKLADDKTYIYQNELLSLPYYFGTEWEEKTEGFERESIKAVDAAEFVGEEECIGIVLRSPGGTPMLAYTYTLRKGQTVGGEYAIMPITEEEYAAFMQ